MTSVGGGFVVSASTSWMARATAEAMRPYSVAVSSAAYSLPISSDRTAPGGVWAKAWAMNAFRAGSWAVSNTRWPSTRVSDARTKVGTMTVGWAPMAAQAAKKSDIGVRGFKVPSASSRYDASGWVMSSTVSAEEPPG